MLRPGKSCRQTGQVLRSAFSLDSTSAITALYVQVTAGRLTSQLPEHGLWDPAAAHFVSDNLCESKFNGVFGPAGVCSGFSP
jgi:hypothetical protein